jgi:hypothetical protein
MNYFKKKKKILLYSLLKYKIIILLFFNKIKNNIFLEYRELYRVKFGDFIGDSENKFTL